jgi:hypothetical protein
MNKIHILSKDDYSKLLTSLQLHNLKANTFGLDEYFPLKNINAVDKLYNDYLQRDLWLEDFLENKKMGSNFKA